MISRKPLQAQYNFEMFYLYLHCGGCFKCTKHHSYSILRWLDRSLGPNWALTASRISRFYLTLLEMSQLYAMSFQACEAHFPSCLAKFGNFYVYHRSILGSLSHDPPEFPINVVPNILNQSTRSIFLQ